MCVIVSKWFLFRFVYIIVALFFYVCTAVQEKNKKFKKKGPKSAVSLHR